MRAHNQITRIAVAAIAAALFAGPVAAAADDQHTVTPGETLSGIAARNHTTVRALAEANGLNDANRIVVGQVLVIPAATPAAATAPATVIHVVAPGETLGRIAGRYGTTARAIADANGIRNINVVVIGSRLTIPAATGSAAAPAAPATVHTVARNETLGAIANRYGVAVGAIVAANGLANANLIRIGDQLTIPAAAASGGGGAGGTSAYGAIGSDGHTGLTGTYVVQAGDSLQGIARQFGVPAVAIAAANGVLPPFNLYANAQLVLSAPNRLPTNLARCPVPGATFVNDWGFPRSGGRAHEGTDLFAPRGSPVVAPVAGVVSHATGAVGGNQFRLRGEDGTTYLGSHMDAFGTSGHVNPGDVVGYVGDTGNARGGRPHLHFEVHPDNGAAMNPYPVVEAAC